MAPKVSAAIVSRATTGGEGRFKLNFDPEGNKENPTLPSPGRATRPTSLASLDAEHVDKSILSIRSPKRRTSALPRFTESPPPRDLSKIKGELVCTRVAELEKHIRRQSKSILKRVN